MCKDDKSSKAKDLVLYFMPVISLDYAMDYYLFLIINNIDLLIPCILTMFVNILIILLEFVMFVSTYACEYFNNAKI